MRAPLAEAVAGLARPVERHVRDVSGRPGIGVVWHFYGSKAMNITRPARSAQ